MLAGPLQLGAREGLIRSGHDHPGQAVECGEALHSTVGPEHAPRRVAGEDLWRWQKQNPSGFGAQA